MNTNLSAPSPGAFELHRERRKTGTDASPVTETENKKEAKRAIKEFTSEFGSKWPRAVAKITDEQEETLLAFYDYPAKHWVHLRTTNPIEGTFAPVRARTDITKGPGSRQAGLAMVFKLMEAAQGRWRRLNGHHLVALVRAGATSKNGGLVEGSEGRRVTGEANPQLLTIPLLSETCTSLLLYYWQ